MLKVLLAQHIEARFLRAPRLKIHNASALALAAGVSQVSASRLVRQLEAEGFLDRYRDQLELVRVPDLLEEWQAAIRRAFKEISCRWVIPGHGPKQFESALRDYQARQLRQASPEVSGRGNSPRVCLGLFAAAEALGLGFVHGVPPVLYVERIEPELIRQLGISKERAEQPDLSLRIPANKESIFRSAVDQKGMPVSDALQVWLDVSNHPSRGKEQADRIRERILRPLLKQCMTE
jgi:DNA-binding MarR family transcriptional regulator